MANQRLLKLLEKGANYWNSWREKNPIKKIDLSGAELQFSSFENFDFSNANLSKVNLANSNLSGSNLSGADLSDAYCPDAEFINTNMRTAILYNADLNHANFFSADLAAATLIKTDLSHAYFTRANLTDAAFCEANIESGEFNTAILDRADFRDAVLTSSRFWFSTLFGANFENAELSWTDFTNTNLSRANLICAIFKNAKFKNANLSQVNLSKTNLQEADFEGANLSKCNLSLADLSKANLNKTILVETNVDQAILTGCSVYGISAWDLKGVAANQSNLTITQDETSTITVDNLQLAQFIYLLLNNKNIRDVIDVITSKTVLILGRFTDERKAVLDSLREELRKMNFTPILFDFDKPKSKDLTGTIETLARMARFIIADLTDPSSIPHELASIVKDLRTTPIQPIKLKGSTGYSMLEDYYGAYKWLLKPYLYKDSITLMSDLTKIITPANRMAESFRK